MKNQSATYPQTRPRTDWSSEVKAPSGEAHAPSGTGLGGMEREAQTSRADMNGMQTSRTDMNGMQTSRAGTDWTQTSGAGMGGTQTSRTDMNGMQSSRTGTDWTQTSGDDWPEANDALSVADQNAAASVDAPIPMGPQVMNGQEMSEIWPNIENNLPNDVIEAPTTMEEVYRGSMKSLLLRNVGNYVVATFLIGTQTTVSWEGILYDVGNDYLAIYQSGRDQYIVSDLYSLKYVEFYDTRRRELCDSLLTAQGPTGNSQRT